MRLQLRIVQFALLIICFSLTSFGRADFQKSEFDHREYMAFNLDNGLQVLLISDPETVKSAASLAVRVGGADDPEDRAGMAHLLEHMLFLGTDKYPELDGYRRFIEQNGGQSNAYTSIDITNYSFSIDPKFLELALDRFSHFFISPLLPPEQVEREREVVDAEFQMRAERDAVLRWAAIRQLYNPKHPASKFISGTADTLKGDVTSDLEQFFHQRYSANLMNLVVLGQEPLHQLRGWVEQKFNPIKNSNANELTTTEPLFVKDQLPQLIKIKSLKNNPSLTLMFPVRNLYEVWRESPDSYIAHILGHEGSGSLLSVLKSEGLADGLYASPSHAGLGAYGMSLRLALTDQGLENWEAAAAIVFQYIREVKTRGIEKWRFDETVSVNELAYHFNEITDIRGYVTTLASVLHKYPQNEIFPALYLIQNYDPNLIQELLEEMHPGNVLAVLTSPDVTTDKVTPYLPSNYSVAKLSDEVIQLWETDSENASDWLPVQNVFLPEDLRVIEGTDVAIPEKLMDENGFELWHQTDTSFDIPKSGFFVSIRTPVVKRGAHELVLKSLYASAINEQLNEFVYPAQMAGLEFSFYGHSRGFSFRISGYNDKQFQLVKQLINVINSPQFDRDVFTRHKSDLKRAIQNRSRDNAYSQTLEEFYSVLVEPYWTNEEELQALERISFESLVDFSNEVFEKINVIALSHGNVSRNEALAMGSFVLEELLSGKQVTAVNKNTIIDLEDSAQYFRAINVNSEDAAIVFYVQGADRSMNERANFALFKQIVETPFFSELRSVQQLGYVVFASYVPLSQVPGLMFVIQSPDVHPEKMKVAISEFMVEFSNWVANLTDSEFEAYRSGLIALLLQDDISLNARTSRYWTALDQKDFDFNQQQEIANELESLERLSFQEFVEDILKKHLRSQFVVLGLSKSETVSMAFSDLPGTQIDDVKNFKSGQELFQPL